MKPSLAVLDMVGTTVKSGDEVPAAFREALGSAGIIPSADDLSRIRGRSKREGLAELLRASGITEEAEIDRVHEGFKRALRVGYGANVEAVPGAEEVLRILSGRIGVVLTTGLDGETAELMLARLGWDALGLTGLVTGDLVERGRPAPDLIFAAMRLAGITDPRSVVVVGDTRSDLQAAAAAGAGWSVGVLGGAHDASQLESQPHTVILESVAGLPGWLEGLGAW